MATEVPCDSKVEIDDIVLPQVALSLRSRLECDREIETLLVAESGVSPSVSMTGGGLWTLLRSVDALRSECTLPIEDCSCGLLAREQAERSEWTEPIDDCSDSVGSGDVVPEPRDPCEEVLCVAVGALGILRLPLNFDGHLCCIRLIFIMKLLLRKV